MAPDRQASTRRDLVERRGHAPRRSGERNRNDSELPAAVASSAKRSRNTASRRICGNILARNRSTRWTSPRPWGSTCRPPRTGLTRKVQGGVPVPSDGRAHLRWAVRAAHRDGVVGNVLEESGVVATRTSARPRRRLARRTRGLSGRLGPPASPGATEGPEGALWKRRPDGARHRARARDSPQGFLIITLDDECYGRLPDETACLQPSFCLPWWRISFSSGSRSVTDSRVISVLCASRFTIRARRRRLPLAWWSRWPPSSRSGDAAAGFRFPWRSSPSRRPARSWRVRPSGCRRSATSPRSSSRFGPRLRAASSSDRTPASAGIIQAHSICICRSAVISPAAGTPQRCRRPQRRSRLAP